MSLLFQNAPSVVDQMHAISNPSSRLTPDYRIYASFFVLFVLVRFGDLLVRNMEWTVWLNGSRTGFAISTIAAAVCSYLTATFLKPRTATMVAWLMCGFVGASTMLLVNSAIGMVVGFVVGGVTLFAKSRTAVLVVASNTPKWFSVAVRLIGVWCFRQLVPIAIGFVTGGMTLLTLVRFGLWSPTAASLTLGIAAVLGALLLVRIVARLPRIRWYSWLVAIPSFVFASIAGLLFSLCFDSQQRLAQMPNVHGHSNGLIASSMVLTGFNDRLMSMMARAPNPLRYANDLTRGIHFESLTFAIGASDKDIAFAKKIPLPMSLTFMKGSLVTDRGFEEIDTRCLLGLHIEEGTQLTEGCLKRLDMSRLMSLQLRGPMFSDAALAEIHRMHALQNLFLGGSRVTCEGLRPVTLANPPLHRLDLSHTKVDDEIFAIAAKLPSLRSLVLTGAPVTGEGLRHLRGSAIDQLFLDHTDLDEGFLAELLPPPNEAPTSDNQASIGTLMLSGISLSESGIQTIARIDGLGVLDIRGSSVTPAAMTTLSRLPLSKLTCDVNELPYEVFSVPNWATELELHYDAAAMEAARICEQTLEISRWRPTGVTVVIHNLRLTNESAREILSAADRSLSWGFVLREPMMSDGQRIQQLTLSALAAMFPTAKTAEENVMQE